MKIGLSCRFEYKSEKLRAILHSNQILELLKSPRVASVDPSTGDGKLDTPYKPSQVGHWYAISQMKPRVEPTFISVGGRLIAQWGTGAGDLANYCTDVTGAEEEVRKATSEKDYNDHVHEWGRRYQKLDEQLKIDTKLPAYTRKALRVAELSDWVAAAKSRLLLGGDAHACDGCPELASSVCSLFLAEAKRAPPTFLISLMLLDLVETSTTYGKGGAKTYTWKSMLMHDVSGVPGRGDGVKTLGKHPMAGAGTAILGRAMLEGKGGNVVTDRAISVMSVWLAHYLQQRNPKLEYFIIEGQKGGWSPQLKREKPDDLLKKDCTQALVQRGAGFSCLIGGTTVGYENVKGDRV